MLPFLAKFLLLGYLKFLVLLIKLPPLDPVLIHINPVHNFTIYFPKINFNNFNIILK